MQCDPKRQPPQANCFRQRNCCAGCQSIAQTIRGHAAYDEAFWKRQYAAHAAQHAVPGIKKKFKVNDNITNQEYNIG